MSKEDRQSVYVLIANEGERVKECIVVSDSTIAHTLFHILKRIYGGACVAMISRAVNEVPLNIQQAG